MTQIMIRIMAIDSFVTRFHSGAGIFDLIGCFTYVTILS